MKMEVLLLLFFFFLLYFGTSFDIFSYNKAPKAKHAFNHTEIQKHLASY